MSRPLTQYLPQLRARLPLVILGSYPTPVEPLAPLYGEVDARLEHVFIKREDQSSSVYGGNKVRTLEVLLGAAVAQGVERIYSVGAYGSNHALATALHAPTAGLQTGAILFPQPPSQTARDNLLRTLHYCDDVRLCSHWASVPAALWKLGRDARRAARPRWRVMAPGGATPLGAMGYVSAALELAEQVRRKELEAPHRIVLAVGSTCTSAGLLVGLRLARELGIAFQGRLPRVTAIRVSPWPVTSPWRVARLARRTSLLLSSWSGRPELAFSYSSLLSNLRVDSRFLGPGYGYPTAAGLEAIRRFKRFGEAALDTTYSAKSMAAVIQLQEEGRAPTLYWATKSGVALPAAMGGEPPASVRRWLTNASAG